MDFFEKYYNLIPQNPQVNEKMNYFLSIEESIENGKKRKEILKNILKYEKFSNANLNLENVYYYIKLSIEDENVDESLNFALKYIIDTENFSRYKAEFQISRLRNLKRIVELLYNENELEYAQKFNEQFTKEICEKEKFILDYQKST